jgi:hypothetical protein
MLVLSSGGSILSELRLDLQQNRNATMITNADRSMEVPTTAATVVATGKLGLLLVPFLLVVKATSVHNVR